MMRHEDVRFELSIRGRILETVVFAASLRKADRATGNRHGLVLLPIREQAGLGVEGAADDVQLARVGREGLGVAAAAVVAEPRLGGVYGAVGEALGKEELVIIKALVDSTGFCDLSENH